MEIYLENTETVVKEFNSDPNQGLDGSKIKPAMQKYGRNVLKAINPVSVFKILIRQFISPPDKFHKSWYSIGDPTETSFSTLAMKAGYNLDAIEKEYPLVKSFAFDSFRKRAADSLPDHFQEYHLMITWIIHKK